MQHKAHAGVLVVGASISYIPTAMETPQTPQHSCQACLFPGVLLCCHCCEQPFLPTTGAPRPSCPIPGCAPTSTVALCGGSGGSGSSIGSTHSCMAGLAARARSSRADWYSHHVATSAPAGCLPICALRLSRCSSGSSGALPLVTEASRNLQDASRACLLRSCRGRSARQRRCCAEA